MSEPYADDMISVGSADNEPIVYWYSCVNGILRMLKRHLNPDLFEVDIEIK